MKHPSKTFRIHLWIIFLPSYQLLNLFPSMLPNSSSSTTNTTYCNSNYQIRRKEKEKIILRRSEARTIRTKTQTVKEKIWLARSLVDGFRLKEGKKKASKWSDKKPTFPFLPFFLSADGVERSCVKPKEKERKKYYLIQIHKSSKSSRREKGCECLSDICMHMLPVQSLYI